MFKRIIALLICFSFISEQTGYAQVAGQFAVPAYLSHLSPVADRFRPVQLRSIEFDPATDNFQLLLDKGDLKSLTPGQAEESSRKLFEYFKIGLALPNSMFWVNLRPDSPDNVIDPYLEKTDLGKVLLEADLQLKKDLARFTNPDTPEGRQYWNKLYEKAEQIYSGQDIEIPTFTRPWIVPGEIIIRESPQGAFIYKATLKVMLEQDHIKDSPFHKFDDPKVKELNEYSSQLLRQLIIPKLTREVNSSRRYGQLRQVYYSLVLAQWFKSRNNDNPLIDQKDLNGLKSETPWAKAAYFNSYKKSFSEGEYHSEETVQSGAGMTIRQYFSGGVTFQPSAGLTMISGRDGGAFNADHDNFMRIDISDPVHIEALVIRHNKEIGRTELLMHPVIERLILTAEEEFGLRIGVTGSVARRAFTGRAPDARTDLDIYILNADGREIRQTDERRVRQRLKEVLGEAKIDSTIDFLNGFRTIDSFPDVTLNRLL
ncbi:MAG: hypothetical protein PHS64_03585, partial [Candidatus Omnitrophica bacterium]|nr:hypothetical protein [Candidatus Omnitrophota bacterium]